jgi:hypothetical protein
LPVLLAEAAHAEHLLQSVPQACDA